MTSADFVSIKEKLPQLSERQRVLMSAELHRLKQNSPAWQREMKRRMDRMDAGEKFRLSQFVTGSKNA
ncbi:MAG: hypothetical protein ACOYOF_03310 [Verrucomicrobiaceae bacterium]